MNDIIIGAFIGVALFIIAIFFILFIFWLIRKYIITTRLEDVQ